MGKASRRKKVDPARVKQVRPPVPFVDRPFEGLVRERELVAMREIIPCATMNAQTNEKYGSVPFTFVTLVPDGAGAMVRGDGEILIGLQTRFHTGDLAHDLGVALAAALAMKETGEEGIVKFDVRDPGPRLQEMIVNSDDEPTMELAKDFGYWFDPGEEPDAQRQAALEENREDMVPTEQVPGVHGMYWCQLNNNFVRYVLSVDEDKLFTGLARLQAAGEARMGEGSKFVGAFRACGIAIPVFQVDPELTPADLAKPAEKLRDALKAAIDKRGPLSDEERRAREGMVSRQVTIR